MEKDFNKAINDFVAWYVRKGISEDISEEEFNKRLEEKKEEIIENIDGVKEKIDLMPLMSSDIENNGENNEYNPFVSIILLMLCPGFNNVNKLVENLVGRKMSEEEIKEYMGVMSSKTCVSNVINFLEENEVEKIYNDVIPPILNNLLCLKDTVLPYFKKLEVEVQEKLDEFIKANN